MVVSDILRVLLQSVEVKTWTWAVTWIMDGISLWCTAMEEKEFRGANGDSQGSKGLTHRTRNRCTMKINCSFGLYLFTGTHTPITEYKGYKGK